jgi:DedD protein
MNVVLMRRLLGAGVMLVLLFIASLLLPAPTDPKPAEPGMRRIEVAVDDTHPIETPKAKARSSEQSDAHTNAEPPPTAENKPAPVSPESAQATAAHYAQQASREVATSPEVATTADEDDDVVAAPTADAAPSEEPPPPAPKPKAEIKPPIAQRTPPPVAITPKPKPAVATPPSVQQKPHVATTAPAPAPTASRPTTPAPAVSTVEKPQPKPASPPPVAPATTPAATASKAPRWAVQAGSYADITNARQIETQLKALGFNASISLTEAGGSARYRVRSGPFATRDAADAARQKMQQGHISANVVPDGG